MLSLFFLGVSLLGYFGRFGFLIAVAQPAVGGVNPRQMWQIGDGRFAVWTYDSIQGETTGYKLHWRGEFRTPRLEHHPLDGFDAHRFPRPVGMAHGGIVYLFSFPLWCVILPSLIAPAWWLYQRRRRKSDPRRAPQGFPIAAGPRDG